MYKLRKIVALDGVTATTVSEPIPVKYAQKATLLFERADHVSGDAIFSIQAALDYSYGGDFIPNVNMISNDVNNHVQTIERQNTVSLGANGKAMYALDLENFCYEYIQVKVTESGSGTSTAKLLIVE